MTEQIDILIAKYLTREASVEETGQLLDWIAADDKNRKYFEQMKTVFINSQIENDVQFDVDAAWTVLNSKLQDTNMFPKIISVNFKSVLRIAAMVVLVSVIGFSVFTWMGRGKEKVELSVSSHKGVLEYYLPDSSKVYLNKNSQIYVSYNPSENKRSVRLVGEAYFDVRHNPDQQFVVEANGLIVRDIGTAFNVKARKDENEIYILVSEGSVAVSDSSNEVVLVEGEGMTYDKGKKTFHPLEVPDSNVIAYKTGIFTFNNTSLDQVAAILNEAFESQIELADSSTKACKLTATFRNESFENIVEVIAATFNQGEQTRQNGGVEWRKL